MKIYEQIFYACYKRKINLTCVNDIRALNSLYYLLGQNEVSICSYDFIFNKFLYSPKLLTDIKDNKFNEYTSPLNTESINIISKISLLINKKPPKITQGCFTEFMAGLHYFNKNNKSLKMIQLFDLYKTMSDIIVYDCDLFPAYENIIQNKAQLDNLNINK